MASREPLAYAYDVCPEAALPLAALASSSVPSALAPSPGHVGRIFWLFRKPPRGWSLSCLATRIASLRKLLAEKYGAPASFHWSTG